MGQRRLRAGLISSEPRRDARQAAEAGGSPSSAPPPGAGLLRGGLAPYSAGLRGSRPGGPSEGGHRSAHCGARESGDSRVLVSNVSVAEIGERHLPHTGEVSREAIRAGYGVGRCGGSFPSGKGEYVRVVRKGAGCERVNGSVIAVVPGSIARLSVNPTEGVLVRVCRRSKPTLAVSVAWRGGGSFAPLQGGRESSRASVGCGAPIVSAAGRQRTSEVTRFGSALSAEGRRGSAAAAGRNRAPCVPRRTIGAEAATAKNCGIGKRGSAARTARPAIGRRYSAKMPHRAASAMRGPASTEKVEQEA